MFLSNQREKRYEDWLFCGFGNSYYKSCYSFDSNQKTLETYLDDTIDSNKQCWSKINPKKAYFSQTRGKNHEDWLYCGFGNSYSKSCYFFDSNNITIKTYWDDTIDGNEQRWSKINPKKACLPKTRGKNHEDWLYCGFGNSHSKFCYFFDSNNRSIKTY